MNYRLVAALALTSALGSAACASDKPAQAPTTVTSVQTTSAEPTSEPGEVNAMPPPSETIPASPTTEEKQAPPEPAAVTPVPAGAPRPARPPAGATTKAPAPAPAAATPPPPASATAPVTQSPGSADQTKNADNTKINERDRSGAALTPGDQGGSAAERNITATIRRAVVADKTLSFMAKNVKIITVGGKVTLRGPVKSDSERAAIESQARRTAGVTDVDNQLEVKK